MLAALVLCAPLLVAHASGSTNSWRLPLESAISVKEDTKVNRSLSGREMLNWPSLQSFPARDKKRLLDRGFLHSNSLTGKQGINHFINLQ